MGESSVVAPLRDRLRAALTVAMKARDTTAVAALRSALSAIDNAEAVGSAHAPRVGGSVFAGAVVGLGAGEAARRCLTPEEIADIVRAEVVERESASAQYERAGRLDPSMRLREEATILRSHLTGS